MLNRLGLVLGRIGRWEEAIEIFRRLLVLQPDRWSIHWRLSELHAALGQVDQALAHCGKVLRRRPDLPGTRFLRATLWLQQGDFRRGWREYERRWQLRLIKPRVLRKPAWDGTALAGRTILLRAEQGLGDTLQFVRYAAVLQARGARVVFETQPPLARVLRGCHGIDQLVAAGDPLPAYDVHASLLSLPWLLRTTLDNVPAPIPYLSADQPRIARWRDRLAAHPGFRVGIVWQGNPQFPLDRMRSMALTHFAPLARVPGVQLVSLQKGDGTAQLRAIRDQFPVVDLGRAVDTRAGAFVDTAAIVANLDLVISADTSVAHLAGALGAPLWLPVGTGAEWRWLRDREDSPWYPSARLFRQRRHGDWAEVFARIAVALTELVSSRHFDRLAVPRQRVRPRTTTSSLAA